MMRRSCFWTWDDNEKTWQSRPFKSRQVRRIKKKEKGKGKGEFKGTGRAFLGEEQAQDPERRTEENCAWWSKRNRGKKGFLKGGFRTYSPEKSASNDRKPHKRQRQGKQKKKARKVLILNLEFQPRKH